MKTVMVKIGGVELDINDVLAVLRPNGYIRYFHVQDLKTGELHIMAEPKINPDLYTVLEEPANHA